MTAVPTDPRFTAEQAAKLAEIEAAADAPESFDPIAALRRVEALAEEWEAEAQRHDDAEPVSTDGLSRMIIAAKHCRAHARDLRAALRPAVVAGDGGER